MNEILRVKNLVRNYEKPSRDGTKEEIKVLKGLDFSINEQEFVAIMGKSGCGKTTLLSIIAGFHAKTSGKVEVFGESYTDENILNKAFLFLEDEICKL